MKNPVKDRMHIKQPSFLVKEIFCFISFLITVDVIKQIDYNTS